MFKMLSLYLVAAVAIVGGSTASAQIPVTDPIDQFESCMKSPECVAHMPPEFAELVRQQQAAEFNRKRALDLADAAASRPAKGALTATAASAAAARSRRLQDANR